MRFKTWDEFAGPKAANATVTPEPYGGHYQANGHHQRPQPVAYHEHFPLSARPLSTASGSPAGQFGGAGQGSVGPHCGTASCSRFCLERDLGARFQTNTAQFAVETRKVPDTSEHPGHHTSTVGYGAAGAGSSRRGSWGFPAATQPKAIMHNQPRHQPQQAQHRFQSQPQRQLQRQFQGRPQQQRAPQRPTGRALDSPRRAAFSNGVLSLEELEGGSGCPVGWRYYDNVKPMQSTLKAPTALTAEQDAKNGLFDVRKYGAKGDGTTDDTDAIQSAIKAARSYNPPAGTRKTVLFPPMGRYLFGFVDFSPAGDHVAVQLLDRVTLLMQPSGKAKKYGLSFSSQKDVVFEGVSRDRSFVHANGLSWSRMCKFSSDAFLEAGNESKSEVPSTLLFTSCAGVLVRNITIFHGPAAHLDFQRCTEVEVYNFRINTPYDSHNTDGIHIDESARVVLHDSEVCNGDDCVAIRTHTSSPPFPPGETEIYACQFISGHGVSWGSAFHGDWKTGYVHDCVFKHCVQAIRFKSTNDMKGSISDVILSNLQMQDMCQGLLIENGDYGDQAQAPASSSGQKGVSLHNITFCGWQGDTLKHAGQVGCQTKSQCDNIVLQNIKLTNVYSDPWQCTGPAPIKSDSSVTPAFDCGSFVRQFPSLSQGCPRSGGCATCSDCKSVAAS